MTLAALLRHSRIQMGLRYADPENHQLSAMRKLETFKAGRMIAECENSLPDSAPLQEVPTISPHAYSSENPIRELSC